MTTNTDAMRQRLIVALDVSSATDARRLTQDLEGAVSLFKVGSQLFTAEGPQFVSELVNAGHRVFLDLKFHDIPNTVAAAAVEATRLGVFMFNVHAAGGREMMLRTREAVATIASNEALPTPLIIAVTVLTSTDDATLYSTGVTASAEEQVKRLAQLTADAGLDGVVASPREVGLIRRAITKPEFVLVIPGVRPRSTSHDDQKRVATPGQTIAAGADFLVVGRPITAAANPRAAVEAIVEEMATAADNRAIE